MTCDLSFRRVHDALEAALREALLRQATDPDDPRFGSVVNLEGGLATARQTAHLITAALYLRSAGIPIGDDGQRRIEMAAAFLRRTQRDSGRFDEPDCNIDSGPVTAFLLQAMLPAIRTARSEGTADAIPGDLDEVIRRGWSGLVDGGFHTPNHRWVWASALAQTADFLGTEPPAVLDDILAEGIDIDADGAYLERSIESYDAVTNLSLLLLDKHLAWDPALPAVQRNLTFDAHLLNADGTVDTILSRRWGGIGRAPLGLAAAALVAADRLDEPRFATMARALWSASPRRDLGSLTWMAFAVSTAPRALEMSGELPARFTRFFPANALWRHRTGNLSASVLAESPNVMSARLGRAQLVRTAIRFSYFGAAGDFLGRCTKGDESGVMLRFDGRRLPRRPAYELPLGSPVAPTDWDSALARRRQRTVPPQAADLTAIPLEDGVSLHLVTTDGLADTPAQIALDFAPGGRWVSPVDLFTPASGSSIVLRGASAAMRYGPDLIRIHVESDRERVTHTWEAMRDTAGPGDCVRVVIPLVTPVDVRLTLTGCTGP